MWSYILMETSIKKKILLVDDEALIALVNKRSLEKYGYEITVAYTGEQAVEACEETGTIDLVLMDIDLGKGIDGPEAAAHILAHHNIPIVFFSSHTEPEVVEKTEKITSYGYVVKNSSITVLDASIKMAFKLFYANKKTEESENKYRFLAESIPDIIFSLDNKGNIQSIGNQSFAHYGYTMDMLIGKSFGNFLHPDDKSGLMNEFFQAIQNKETTRKGLRFRIITTNNSVLWAELSSNVRFDENGIYLGEEGVIRDITERKRIEDNLYASNELLKSVLDTIPHNICWKDTASVIIGCNKNHAQWVGLTDTQSIIGKTDYDLPWKKSEAEKFIADDKKIMESNLAEFHIIEPAYNAQKIESWLETNKVPLHDPDGKVTGILVTSEDITERIQKERSLEKQNVGVEAMNEELRALTKKLQTQNIQLTNAKELLRQSENRFSLFMDYLPAIVFMKDADGKTLYMNKSMQSVVGSSSWMGKTMTEIFPNEIGLSLLADDIETLRLGYKSIEEDIPHIDGTLHSYNTQKFSIQKTDSTFLIGGISIDITERKKAEDTVKSLLVEKELILKEVHHRIKNNMLTISRLLAFQAEAMSDLPAKAALTEACNRIKGMHLLYEKLFQSVKPTELSTATYFIPLIDEIISSFPNKENITVEHHIEDIILPAQTLQPLGLLINELLSNCMKYAFIGRDSGVIRILISQHENRMSYIIEDDGIGIPESITFEHTTGFGLVLVNGLAQQLGGTIRIERGQGTKIVLEFERGQTT